jgi:putative transcriptional regulator
METLDGHFLIAMPNMKDSRFARTVIFLCAHSREGAMGFVVNRSLEAPSIPDFFRQLSIVSEDELDQLPSSVKASTLYSGGPVEPGRGFVLHSAEFMTDTTLPVSEGVCLTATLEILRAISTGTGPAKSLLALGYSGWASGQLEQEIAANGWLTAPADQSILFDCENELKYNRALETLGVDPLLLSGDSGHA